MKKEIGSEFWDIPITRSKNNLFAKECVWHLSGRSAEMDIARVLLNSGVKTIAMPNWCCDSMIQPFICLEMKVHFYPWNCREISVCDDALFVMDYFGYKRDINFNEYKGIVIRDLTHSLLCGEYNDADYYFGSLRKLAGFWTGGFAWGPGLEKPVLTNEEYIKLRKKAMQMKSAYMSGKILNKDYLNLFDKAEKYLGKYEVRSASIYDIDAAIHLDIDMIKQKRRNNALVILNSLKEMAIFKTIEEEDCPMFVPILVEERDELRKKLIDNEIFCPVHWNTDEMQGKELSLVCDQRYDEEDMLRMVKVIKGFYA